jgi:hypothetical protein
MQSGASAASIREQLVVIIDEYSDDAQLYNSVAITLGEDSSPIPRSSRVPKVAT